MSGLAIGGALAVAGVLAILALVWFARRAGRDAERVNTLERSPMPRIDSSKRRMIALAIALTALAACAPAISSSCPPLVEYDHATRDRAADELELLPEGSAIERLLDDYAVLRDQVRACR